MMTTVVPRATRKLSGPLCCIQRYESVKRSGNGVVVSSFVEAVVWNARCTKCVERWLSVEVYIAHGHVRR